MFWGLLFATVLGFSPIARAQLSFTETFSNQVHFNPSSSTLVWNYYFHMLHPPLAISYTSGVNNEDSTNASVGYGTNGIFDVGAYANFSVGGVTPGNVITIDTSAHPLLQFVSFNLAAGWTIRGVGPNPLWFEVLGPVTISGIIDCSGDAGGNADTNSSPAVVGGVGHCGGGNGGTGSYSGSGGIAGSGASAGGTTAGGSGGHDGNLAGGGGGGGSFRSHASGGAANGITAGGAGGGFGAGQSDPQFTVFGLGQGGGSGGGGGGYNPITGGRGAGGGGGGGVVRITAIGNITVNGTVITKGGMGGGGTGGGGGGGGGGAGSIWFQTPGTITNNGMIDAGVHSGAPDGSNAGVVTGANNGGQGSDGRTWLTSNSTYITPAGSETPISELLSCCTIDAGETHFSVAAGYTAQTFSYDAMNTSPSFLNFIVPTTLPGTSTYSLMVAGSDDNFQTDNTGFVPSANVSVLQGKRFIKFQISIQETSVALASTAASVNSITAVYNGVQQNNFNFSPACGYIGGGPAEFLTWLSLLLAFYFGFTIVGRSRRSPSP